MIYYGKNCDKFLDVNKEFSELVNFNISIEVKQVIQILNAMTTQHNKEDLSLDLTFNYLDEKFLISVPLISLPLTSAYFISLSEETSSTDFDSLIGDKDFALLVNQTMVSMIGLDFINCCIYELGENLINQEDLKSKIALLYLLEIDNIDLINEDSMDVLTQEELLFFKDKYEKVMQFSSTIKATLLLSLKDDKFNLFIKHITKMINNYIKFDQESYQNEE